jgi:UDP-glucose 4-epimerase
MSADRSNPVVVTGGAGFVGLHLVEWLARQGQTVISLDRSPPDGVARDVAARFGDQVQFQRCDARDAAALGEIVTATGGADIVHAAAITSGSVQQALAMLDLHVRTTQVLIDLARDGLIRRLVILSSAGVLQSPDTLETLPEEYPVTLDSAYAITKHAAERLVSLARMEGIDAVALRLPAIYGPYERPTRSRSRMSPVFEAVRLARAGTPIVATGADARRDWTHADDIAMGIALVLRAGALDHGLYHLGAGQGYTTRETLEAVAAVIPATQVDWVDDPGAANVPVSTGRGRAALGIDRARTELGFQPAFSLETGIRDYVATLAPDREPRMA